MIKRGEPQTTRIYLVRHGEPQSHLPDGKLTALGEKQARDIAAFIESRHCATAKTILIVSPTIRTQRTADPVCETLHTRPLVHSEFCEDYLVDSSVSFISPKFLAHQVAARRILRAFRHVARANFGKTVIIVTHGNVIRVLLGKLLGKSYAQMSNMQVPCGSVSEIVLENHPPALEIRPNVFVPK